MNVRTPEGWTRVYWPSEAIELLQTGQVTELSLDHDLGDDARGTGYDVVLWVEEQVAMHGFVSTDYRRALGQYLSTSQDGERNPSNSEHPQSEQGWELALAPTRRLGRSFGVVLQ